ncbi:rhomboid family intramembrane serine protease [Shewanella waksmanii]|uniref:rhomboid family intramembrane serine protease n=1 Tax=Shewanella waksmanii TaxID=213783 RepID=UPI00048B95E1|nr:rhomboid family intramembrane serine protease [Shewanella waksmanii]
MTMQCPSCQSKHFDVFDFHGEEVDRCQDCCGLWFERGELNSALSTADNGDDRVRLERSLGQHLGQTSRQCCHCQQPMQHFHLMEGFEVEIDICSECHGVWLDADETQKVVHSPKIKQVLGELDRQISIKTWLFQFLSQMPVEFNIKPKHRPWVTYLLMLVNIGIFMAYGFNLSAAEVVFDEFAMRADHIVAGQQPWTLLTHMFLHGDLMHLAGNMYFLYVVGDNLEDALGKLRFVGLYLLCGFAAAAAQIGADPQSNIAMVGASGAIAGLFGMYLLWFRHASLTFMFIVFQKKLSPMAFFAIWLVFNIVGLMMAGQGVAYWAHIGGFVAGLLVGLSLKQSVMARNPLLSMLNQPELKIQR